MDIMCFMCYWYYVVFSPHAWHAGDLGSISGTGVLHVICKNLALNNIDCLCTCLSDDTLKAVGYFYLVSMSGEVK